MSIDVRFKGSAEGPTDIAGPTGRLADWLHRLTLDDVPQDVQARAKHVILDGIGCALVGAQLPWSRIAVETILRFEGTGDSTIMGWGRTASGHSRAIVLVSNELIGLFVDVGGHGRMVNGGEEVRVLMG